MAMHKRIAHSSFDATGYTNRRGWPDAAELLRSGQDGVEDILRGSVEYPR